MSQEIIKNTALFNYTSQTSFLFRDVQCQTHLCHIPAGGELSYAAPTKFIQTALPYTILISVKAGEASLHIEGSEDSDSLTLSQGDFLLLFDHTAFDFATLRTPFLFDVFFLDGGFLPDYRPFLCGDHNYLYQQQASLNGSIRLILSEMATQFSSKDEVSSLHLSALLHLLFSALTASVSRQPDSSIPSYVLQMKQLFDTDYQHPHSLKELEQTLGISHYRLCRDFSLHIGNSPLQYLNQVRLTEARHLLRSTNLTIREIGELCGIENTTHFINLFKKNTGITPLQFRHSSTF